MSQVNSPTAEENWVKPNEFLPERWSSKPELIKEKDAFIPFSTGPFGCIGKNLGKQASANQQILFLTAVISLHGDQDHHFSNY